ncbi:MAG: hypothetical protein Q8O89_08215 [Nanoarchaeota archaeon]|nr:hypothetical protein [Nanoarchaeota archaeon]
MYKKIRKGIIENKFLILILLITFIITSYPSFKYKLPVVQTDGASYYGYAKVYAETNNFDALNPAWNMWGSLEQKVSDYPPLFTILLGNLLKITNKDIFLINGFLLSFFFLLAIVYVYLITLELTKNFENNKKIALLSAIFIALNVRAYFHIFSGQFTLFISACLAFPAIYYTIKYCNEKMNIQLVASFIFVLLAGLTYMQQVLYILILQFAYVLGHIAKRKVKIEFPKIDIKFKFDKSDTKKIAIIIFPTVIIFTIIFLTYGINSNRSGFLSTIISSLFDNNVAGFQAIWAKFFITDGPILFTMALIGLIYLIYTQEWNILGIILGGSLIVISGSLFFVGEPMIKMLVYKFYFTFSVLMAISASIIFVKLLSVKNLKNLFKFILILCLIIEITKVGFFYSQIGEAITLEEYQASLSIKDQNENMLFIFSDEADQGFKCFKWILVFSRSEKYDALKTLPENLSKYKTLFIIDKNKINLTRIEELSIFRKTFEGNNVIIYQIK